MNRHLTDWQNRPAQPGTLQRSEIPTGEADPRAQPSFALGLIGRSSRGRLSLGSDLRPNDVKSPGQATTRSRATL